MGWFHVPGVRACAVHAHTMCMSHAGCLFVSVNAAPMGALEGELRDEAGPLHAEFGFARPPGISPFYREAPCFFFGCAWTWGHCGPFSWTWALRMFCCFF